MDFTLDDSQLLIQQNLQALLRSEFPFTRRQQLLAAGHGDDPELWARLAELGYLGMFLDPELGGGGAGPIECLLVMQCLGEGLTLEPFLGTAIVTAAVLNAAPRSERIRSIARDLEAGRLRVGLAPTDWSALPAGAPPRSVLESSATAATLSGPPDRMRIDGVQRIVLGAPCATHLLVVAGGGAAARSAAPLLLVPLDAAGVRARHFRLHDGTPAADIELDGVAVDDGALLVADGLGQSVEHIEDLILLAACAESLGCTKQLLAATVEYTRTRSQFGTTLSHFQVLQHRMADMWMAEQQTEALLLGAAGLLAERAPAARRALAAAKAHVGRAGVTIGHGAVQLHGGIGVTQQLSLGHYFKRLTVLGLLFGSAEQHEARFAWDPNIASPASSVYG